MLSRWPKLMCDAIGLVCGVKRRRCRTAKGVTPSDQSCVCVQCDRCKTATDSGWICCFKFKKLCAMKRDPAAILCCHTILRSA
ncbi:hypothetical protein PBY51_006129 [Eleginops maclovinus]|uniref:Uncharacterized protein n=1 Tax=Eleginops maclovinus TaxID=56733 RepID=A0AAN7WRB8_ELEMC|nr:hypothetical protein PBY51_006129 [Eleginops maclovinus]